MDALTNDGDSNMRIYHNVISSNARRVAMVAAHLKADVEFVEINLMSQDDRRRLGELNPNCKIPVLEDDGFLLWESCAIMQYLAEKTPGQTVYPAGVQVRADINRWMFWACQHFAPAIGVLTWERVWKGIVTGQGPDAREEERGESELADYATVLDKHLAGRQWVVGDSLTLADLALAAPVMYIDKATLPLAGYPNLMAWYGRVQQLPAWQQTEQQAWQA
ncbi:glutathione S-transferase family protein [Pseudoduganella sp. LjRoot289]|uniref:glutathione S-transferase family protein n=1 Tax=Pseudoduganella sp. LjRoot289 TaxID=3342314 RepID=UPI003ECEF629